MLSEDENYAIAAPLAQAWADREYESKKYDDPTKGMNLS